MRKIDTLNAKLDYWNEALAIYNEWFDIVKYKDYIYVKNKIKEIKKEIRGLNKND